MNEIIDTFFTVRPFQAMDSAGVRRVSVACYPETRNDMPFDWSNFQFCFVVDRARFGIIGYAAACPVALKCGHLSRKQFHIATMGVLPDFQRFGYGRKLMAALVAAVDEFTNSNGRIQTYLLQTSEDLGAACFLKACGFKGRTVEQDFIKFDYLVKKT